MSINELYEDYLEKVKNNLIFTHDKYNSHEIFVKYRNMNGGKLSESDELFLLDLLPYKDKRWFVPHVLRVVDTFSEKMMYQLLETAIEIEDPSYNNNFLSQCVRVYDLKVNEYLVNRFSNATKPEKIGILRSFYWVRSRVRHLIHLDDSYNPDSPKEEVYGAKYIWNENSFTDSDYYDGVSKSDVRMKHSEFVSYKEKVDKLSEKRTEMLLDEVIKETDIEMKYRISLCLPKNLEDYPSPLKAKAIEYLTEKKNIPENIVDLVQIQKIKKPIFRKLVLFVFKIKNWNKRRKGLISLKDK